MAYETLQLTWQHIAFTLAYDANYFNSDDMQVSHAEIHCDQALPITETGYKSIFMTNVAIDTIEQLAEELLQEMDRLAQTKNWQPDHQLSLF